MSYVYWIIAYFAIAFIFSGLSLYRYLKQIIDEYRRYHCNIKDRLDYDHMAATVVGGILWPLCIVVYILSKSKAFFTSYIPSKLESYAKRKHPEDFI